MWQGRNKPVTTGWSGFANKKQSQGACTWPAGCTTWPGRQGQSRPTASPVSAAALRCQSSAPLVSNVHGLYSRPFCPGVGRGRPADAPAAAQFAEGEGAYASFYTVPPPLRRQLAGLHGALLLRAGCHPVHRATRQDGHYPLLFVLSLRFPEPTLKHLLKLLLLSRAAFVWLDLDFLDL